MTRIAIGVGENENIIQACHIFKEKHPKNDIILIYSDEDLIKAVLDRNIDCVIRGSLPASNIMNQLKEKYPNLSRATYINKEGDSSSIFSYCIAEHFVELPIGYSNIIRRKDGHLELPPSLCFILISGIRYHGLLCYIIP